MSLYNDDPPTAQAALRDATSALGAAPWLAAAADALLATGFAAALTAALSGSRAACLGVALALAARGLLAAWLQDRAARLSLDLRTSLRRLLLAAMLNGPEAPATGAAAALAVDDVAALDGFVVRHLPARAAARLAPLLLVGAAIAAAPLPGLVLLATLIPFAVAMALAGGAAASAAARQLEALARLSALFADRVRALPLIIAYAAGPAEAMAVGAAANAAASRTVAVLRVAFLSSAVLEFFAALSVALVAVLAGFALLGLLPWRPQAMADFAHLFFVLALAPEVYAPFRRLAASYHEKQLGEAAAARIDAALALPRAPAPAPLRFAQPPGIVMRAVRVAAGEGALGPFDIDLPGGEILALMGPTGAGKTTLLRLLVGEARLLSGTVAVGGVDLATAGSFVEAVAWAGQAPFLLPASIGENIVLANPAATPAQVADAAARAGLGPVLAARPGGLAALLDARGSGLSGGERRRIGLARALLKPAPVLLLDEPTADLDPASAAALAATIRAAAQGRTVIIATHAPELASIATRVVTL